MNSRTGPTRPVISSISTRVSMNGRDSGGVGDGKLSGTSATAPNKRTTSKTLHTRRRMGAEKRDTRANVSRIERRPSERVFELGPPRKLPENSPVPLCLLPATISPRRHRARRDRKFQHLS